MASVFETAPYPFHLPEAQELHRLLAELFPKTATADLIAKRAGLETYDINFDQAIIYVWKEILEKAANWRRLRILTETALDKYPEDSPGGKLLKQLLSDQQNLVLPASASDSAERAAFIRKNDNITEPEALLFHDDLTIRIGFVPQLIGTLKRLLQLSPSVCRITADFNGRSMYGTAFRVGTRALLTNWHVLHHKTAGRATAVTAEFGYDDDGAGCMLDAHNVSCDVNIIVGHEQSDWAVIQATENLPESCEIIALDGQYVPEINTPTYIIQHPAGDRKRIGFVRNLITDVDDAVIHYLTDTQPGSSGSAVFNVDGHLVALHRAGGRPQEVAGREPMKKNEGIRVSHILKDMREMGVNLANL